MMFSKSWILAVAAGSCALTAAIAQAPVAAPMPQGQPGIPASGVQPVPENQAVLDALMQLGTKPYHTLTPLTARQQPTFADGVMAAMRARGLPTTPPPGTKERDISIPGPGGAMHARIFTPTGARGRLPVILYFHGGGWVLADSKVYASSARGLARGAQAVVVSVDYRRAPEAPFPAQHDDALAAYRWLLSNAKTVGGDASRIALAGESAGGNLAIATAMQARDGGLPQPRHILSVYPIAGNNLNTSSYQENSNAMPLGRATMAWFYRYVPRQPADLMDPRINLVGANLQGLAPVTIVAAQIDPLRSEGEMLAQQLSTAGVRTERREWANVTHEFFGADALIPAAKEAQAWASEQMRAAFQGSAPATGVGPDQASQPAGERG